MAQTDDNLMNKSTQSLYKLHFPLLPFVSEVSDQKQFTIFIQGTLLPSLTLNTNNMPFMGQDFPIAAGGIEFGSWSTSFIVDEKWKSYLLLYNWLTGINNGIDKFGAQGFDYMSEGILTILDNYQNPIIEFKFINIWPTELSEVELDYQNDAEHIIGNVVFAYTYFMKV